MLPETVAGSIALFTDPRVRFALERFANSDESLKGQRMLEIGPLEGGHTYQLEQFGAEVAIECNMEAYLKCPIVKELVGLKRARFLYGEVTKKYLEQIDERFDLIFCCGVLYDVKNPVALIEAMARWSKNVFVWTHYYHANDTLVGRQAKLSALPIEKDGEEYTYYRRTDDEFSPSLISRDDIMRAFRQLGLFHCVVHQEELTHPGGPAFSFSVWAENEIVRSLV